MGMNYFNGNEQHSDFHKPFNKIHNNVIYT